MFKTTESLTGVYVVLISQCVLLADQESVGCGMWSASSWRRGDLRRRCNWKCKREWKGVTVFNARLTAIGCAIDGRQACSGQKKYWLIYI